MKSRVIFKMLFTWTGVDDKQSAKPQTKASLAKAAGAPATVRVGSCVPCPHPGLL